MKAEMVTEVRNYLPDQPKAPVTRRDHNLRLSLEPNPVTGIKHFCRAWDMTQSQLHCCGLMTEQVEEAWQVRIKRNPFLGEKKKPGVMSATWPGVAEEPSSEPNSG